MGAVVVGSGATDVVEDVVVDASVVFSDVGVDALVVVSDAGGP